MSRAAVNLWIRRIALASLPCLAATAVLAAPDEEALGRSAGYPVARNGAQAFEEFYRVGSFSAMDQIAAHCSLSPSPTPLAMEPAPGPPPGFRYSFQGQSHTLDDYLQRQRATALLVVKDGRLVLERYQYGRTAEMRMLSNSMAKTIVALAVGKALEQGHIRSLDDTAASYARELAGTLYGETPILHLLRMASGARFVEDYSGNDDHAQFNRTRSQWGAAQAAKGVRVREAPSGERFNYASAETQMLGLVLRAATGRSLCDYVSEHLWQPLGAQAGATWLVNPRDRVEIAAGSFNATARDWARLGWMMANDGMSGERRVLSADWLLAMTDPARQPEAFRPGRMNHKGSTFLGYGLQTWLLPGNSRRFQLLGIHGQAILVDPALKLVVVHLAVGKDASGNASGHQLGAERTAMMRGIVTHYGSW